MSKSHIRDSQNCVGGYDESTNTFYPNDPNSLCGGHSADSVHENFSSATVSVGPVTLQADLIEKQTQLLDDRFSGLESLLHSEISNRENSIASEHRFTIKCTLICGIICAIIGAFAGYVFAQFPL